MTAIAATLVTAATVAGPAQATDKAGQERTVVEVPMKLLCDKLDAAALSYAVEHRYCNADGSSVISPSGVVVGDCGSSFIFLENRGGPGEGRFRWGFNSTRGAVVFRWRGNHLTSPS